MGSPVTDSIWVGPGDLGDGGLGVDPFNTLGGQRFKIEPANAHLAFAAARDALGAQGGDLWVAPRSSAKYKFGAIVDFGTKPVEIKFAHGAVLDLADGNSRCFTFRRPTRLIDLQFECDVKASPGGRSVALFDDTTVAQTTVDIELIRPKISVSHAEDGIIDFKAFRVHGNSPTQNTRRLIMSDASFVVRPGTQQSWSWQGEETSGVGTNEFTGNPYGCGLLFARYLRSYQITGLSIAGLTDGASDQRMGNAIMLEDCRYGRIKGLNVENLTLKSVGSHGTLIVNRAVSAEGGHMNIGDIFCEVSNFKHFLCMRDMRWILCSDAQFGRIVPNLTSLFTNSNGPAKSKYFALRNLITHNMDEEVIWDFNDVHSISSLGHEVTFRTTNATPFKHTNCQNVNIDPLGMIELKDA